MSANITMHVVFLDRRVLSDPQWEHLRCFVHPGCRDQTGDAVMIVADLDFSSPAFLRVRAVDWQQDHRGSRVVLLRLDLVASILEAVSHKNPLGFVDLKDARERLAAPSEARVAS